MRKFRRYLLSGAAVFAIGFGLLSLHAQEVEAGGASVRFRTVDIYVESKGKPLAAYQLEFSVTNGNAKIVGIEGGETPAFSEPPFYDPKAMQQDRVIIAAFCTETATVLPKGITRVATIHLQISGKAEPEFELKLQTAADADGHRIPAQANTRERQTK